ncbi:gamma-aminobutyric acid type B receptor subunit 2-like [Dysidea avara]|uniref:gamma-aminobutyric acid type B receptor subunit 2-like n=1 Tax=Dysidea avara TaxID=196820 RepID=UPI00332854A7
MLRGILSILKFAYNYQVVTGIIALLWSAGSSTGEHINERQVPTTLQVLGLFSYRGSDWDGEYVIPAARLAKDEINRNDSILPGYVLELIEANSGCDRDRGVRKFVRNALHSEQHLPVAIIGTGCSSSTIPIASICGRKDIALPQVSYGAASPFLSFTDSFPYFYRTVPTDEYIEGARISLMKKFNWKRYGIHNTEIGGDNEVWIDHSITALRAGIQQHIMGAEEVYTGEPYQQIIRNKGFEKAQFVDEIRTSGMRVGMIYGLQESLMSDLLCILYRHNLVYPQIIWMLIDLGTYDQLYSPDCKPEEMRQATEGIIYMGHQYNSTSEGVFDVTNKTFEQYYKSYINESRNYASERKHNDSNIGNIWSTFTYDAMWALGLALHKAEEKLSNINSSLADFTLGNSNISEAIIEELAGINFAGASGNVSFDKTHKRQFLAIAIQQVQNGALKKIGLYSPSSDSSQLGILSLNENAFLWSVENPPADSFPIKTLLAETWVVVLMCLLLTVGILWNNFFLLINFHYQNFYSIKSSSARLNHLMFAGNNLLLLGGIMVVIKVTDEYEAVVFGTLCQSTWWLFDLGLLLVLIITLLKSWRIYRIFNSFEPGKFLTDNTFIAITTGCIIINTIYHSVFVMVNNTNFVRVKILPSEGFVRQKVMYCQPSNWWGILYLPHLVMMIILCVLAFAIRKVRNKQFNDAKNIATFFYITALVVPICAGVSYAVSPANDIYDKISVSLLLNCTAILCIAFTCQLTLFVPKMIPLFKHLYYNCFYAFL